MFEPVDSLQILYLFLFSDLNLFCVEWTSSFQRNCCFLQDLLMIYKLPGTSYLQKKSCHHMRCSKHDSVFFHIGTKTKNRAQINLTELNNQSRSNLGPQILRKLWRLCVKPSGLIWLFRLVVVGKYNIHRTLANTQLLVYFMHEKRRHVLYVRSLCKRENMPHRIIFMTKN